MNNVCPTECKVGIAIVEDEKDLVRAYERMFQLYNIKICFVAYDGLEAVKKYRECNPKPHVVIMDYRLPILSGIDAMKEIRKIDPTAKFIFLSADPSVKDDALKAGATTFLVKPTSFKIILKEVKNIIGQAPG
jgi:two-component system, chemotaxis family, chemotaxis protein CheY